MHSLHYVKKNEAVQTLGKKYGMCERDLVHGMASTCGMCFLKRAGRVMAVKRGTALSHIASISLLQGRDDQVDSSNIYMTLT